MELLIILIATFGQAMCAPSIAVSVVGVIIFWRFIVRPILLASCFSPVDVRYEDGFRNRWGLSYQRGDILRVLLCLYSR